MRYHGPMSNTTTTTRLTFTTAAFLRSTGGKAPRNNGAGAWAFQRTTRETAFAHEMEGDPLFFRGTLPEAKRKLKAAGHTGLWAILP
jgi:hypothetical protein